MIKMILHPHLKIFLKKIGWWDDRMNELHGGWMTGWWIVGIIGHWDDMYVDDRILG